MFSRIAILIGHSPRIEGELGQELSPLAWHRFDLRRADQRLDSLLGGGHKEIEHFVGTELGGDGLNVRFHALNFGRIQISRREFNDGTQEDGDDPENKHDFNERKAT